MASPELEPVAESVVTAPVPEPAAEVSAPPADAEAATVALVATEEETSGDPKLDLPIYRWFGTEDAEDTAAAPGWPRSLLGRQDAG